MSSQLATDGNWITLPVRVNGNDFTFVVDTGSPVTLLDMSFKKRLVPSQRRLEKELFGESIEIFCSPEIEIAGTRRGKITFPREYPVGCKDMSAFSESAHVPIHGVVGMDVLGQFAMQLDVDNGVLRLLEGEKPYDVKPGSEVLEMEVIKRHPIISFKSGRETYWALIDTGALLCLHLGVSDYRQLLRSGRIVPDRYRERVGGDYIPIRQGRLKDFQLSAFAHHEMVVDSADDEFGLLGLWYWRRFNCVFDFPRSKVHLEKSRYFNHADESDHCGIFLGLVPGSKAVKQIDDIREGGLGEILGLEVGDRFSTVDGVDAEKLSIYQIYYRLSFRPDREIELIMRRGNEERRVKVPKNSVAK